MAYDFEMGVAVWPSERPAWWKAWLEAWHAIGWLASTDIMQAELVRAVKVTSAGTQRELREMKTQMGNMQVQLDWALHELKARRG